MRIQVAVPHILGGHCASSAFRDLAAFHWPADPRLSEPLIFLLSGGLDFLYWRRPGADPPIYLLGRTGPLEAQLAARLGVELTLVRPESPAAAWAWLRATLAARRPAMVMGDVGELPYLNARTHFTLHVLLVVGIDDEAGTLTVLDNDREGVQVISQAAFAASWGSTAFPAPTAFRYYELRWPVVPPPLGTRLAGAIADTVRQLDGGGTPFLPLAQLGEAGGVGLAGLALFAGDLVRAPSVFPTTDLPQALRAVYLYVEKAGTGFGGFFRGIFGSGLRESAALIADPSGAAALEDAGAHYQALGRQWSALAAACRAAAPLVGSDPQAILAPLAARAAELLTAERRGRELLADLAAILTPA